MDNPESIVGQGLEDVTKENAIRIGSFFSILNHLHSLGIQVIVFVKEHILRNVQKYYLDSTHFEDRIEGLEWTDSDLMDLIKIRIKKKLHLEWGDVFALNQTEFKDNILPCLINGPRDLLNICNTAGKEATNKITNPTLMRSIDVIKKKRWEHIYKQFNEQWPRIDELAQLVISLIMDSYGNKPFTRAQFKTAFEKEFHDPETPLNDLRTKEKWIRTAKWADPSVDEILFIIGCFGYVYKGEPYFPWAGRSLERFGVAEKIFISPLFW